MHAYIIKIHAIFEYYYDYYSICARFVLTTFRDNVILIHNTKTGQQSPGVTFSCCAFHSIRFIYCAFHFFANYSGRFGSVRFVDDAYTRVKRLCHFKKRVIFYGVFFVVRKRINLVGIRLYCTVLHLNSCSPYFYCIHLAFIGVIIRVMKPYQAPEEWNIWWSAHVQIKYLFIAGNSLWKERTAFIMNVWLAVWPFVRLVGRSVGQWNGIPRLLVRSILIRTFIFPGEMKTTNAFFILSLESITGTSQSYNRNLVCVAKICARGHSIFMNAFQTTNGNEWQWFGWSLFSDLLFNNR